MFVIKTKTNTIKTTKEICKKGTGGKLRQRKVSVERREDQAVQGDQPDRPAGHQLVQEQEAEKQAADTQGDQRETKENKDAWKV